MGIKDMDNSTTKTTKSKRVKKEMKNEVSILVTRDKLYYVVYGEPHVIQEKAMKKAEELQQILLEAK